MNPIDFARSFLQFTTVEVDHTPRLQIDAVCRLSAPGRNPETFVLTAPCICERMYVAERLVQDPPREFILVANDNDQFLFMKTGALHALTERETHRVGETMSTHDGRGGTMRRITIRLVETRNVRPLTDYPAIRAAILGNEVLAAQTVYEEPDGTQVALCYPVKVCNVAHDRRMWQVDTGRILFPARSGGADLTVACFEPAYIVYHAWDWAEFAILRHTSAAGGPDYSDIRRLSVRNTLYALARN